MLTPVKVRLNIHETDRQRKCRKMNVEHLSICILKGVFDGYEVGPCKYGEFSAAPTVDPTVARVLLNKRRVCALTPVSRETSSARHNTRVLPLLN